MPENHPFYTAITSLQDFVTQLEIKFGGQPSPGQLVREGHLPKYSKLIDKLEDLAIMFLEARQYADLLKDSDIQSVSQLEERQALREIRANRTVQVSTEKLLTSQVSPFNTYVHSSADTYHIRQKILSDNIKKRRTMQASETPLQLVLNDSNFTSPKISRTSQHKS